MTAPTVPGTSTHITACPLDCPDTCSTEVTVTDGRIVKVDAAPGNPFTDGFICQKVKHHARRVYAPERVMTPLLRTGPKGAGEFRAATWDEALDLVVDRLRAAEAGAGPESVVPYVYNSSAPLLQDEAGERLWRRFGASRVRHTICAATFGAAYRSVFGDMLSADPLDVVHSQLIVLWGANPTVSNIHFAPLVTRAQKEHGAPVVVVDPRGTASAKRADLHLAVRPGTDVVLAYAVAHELAHRDLLDRGSSPSTRPGSTSSSPPRPGTPSTSRPGSATCRAASITELAELLGTVRPALVRAGWGLERNRNGGSACAAVFSLPVLAGQFGEAGAG